MPVLLEDRLPTVDEHTALAASVGWSDHFDPTSIGASLAGSTFGVVALDNGTAIGMARLVGDGVHYFYVQDVIVHPDHADGGLGSQLIERLLDYVAQVATSEAFVGLFASPEAVDLYREFRFVTTDMTGMYRFIDPS